MSEITALTRISLARHRWLLVAMVVTVVIGACVAWLSAFWFPSDSGDPTAVVALWLSLMPAGIASIVLFDYGLDQDLNLPDSGCSHWILRMPIRAWKIAMVPVVLKSLWISGLWLVFLLSARLIGSAATIPLIMPCIVFSAITIWIMVISWRPFQSSLRRLALLLVASLVLYCTLVGTFASPSIELKHWRAIANAASVVSGLALYIGGAWCLIRSTQLARLSPGGIVPTDGPLRMVTGAMAASPADATLPIRRYRDSLHALVQHDIQKSWVWVRGLYAFCVVPTIIIFTLLIPVNAASVIAAVFLFVYFAGIAGSRTCVSSNASSALPSYLSASPLSTKTLAWGRLLFPLLTAMATYLCLLILIAGWTCWESNRETWMRWAEAQATSLGQDASPIVTGMRLSTAIVLGVGVLLVGRIAAFSWVGMTGRSWVAVGVTIVASLVVLIPFGVSLRWFMKQTDWESTQASALHLLTLLPWLVGGLLIVKALTTVVVGLVSIDQQLITITDVTRVVGIWTALTCVLAVIFHALIPYPLATLTWSLAITALAIPLARLLVLPLAVSWDRHR